MPSARSLADSSELSCRERTGRAGHVVRRPDSDEYAPSGDADNEACRRRSPGPAARQDVCMAGYQNVRCQEKGVQFLLQRQEYVNGEGVRTVVRSPLVREGALIDSIR